MALRTITLSLLFFLFAPPLFAVTYNNRSLAYRKTVTLHRTDPRLKYLNSHQISRCARAVNGVCTTSNEDDGSQYIHYVNTIREKESTRQRKIRPWL